MQISTPSYLNSLERPQLRLFHQSDLEPKQVNDKSFCTNSGVPVINQPESPQPIKKQQRVVEVFYSTFLTIFLAEFGDKTQLSTLLMSAQSQSPWVVFLGSAAALITTSLLGVLLGQWLATRLSPRTLETAAGASLLLISVMLLWDIAQS